MTEAPKKTLDLSSKSKSLITTKKVSAKKCEFRIKQCWNVIRYIAEHEHFSDKMVNEIEVAAIPLIRYIEDPSKISFDDDIIFFISSILKKSKSCHSQVLQESF